MGLIKNLEHPVSVKSIVLVSNAEGKNFGTGFAVWRDEDQNETWIATCAHVLKEISRQQTDIRVDNRSASILADGASKGIDLALLRVSGSQIPILPLRLSGSENMPVSIPGYTTLTSEDRKAYTLSAKLGRSGIFQRQGGGAQVDAWELLMTDKAGRLEKGYSGSPVICEESGAIVAVASHKDKEGSGHAIALANLRHIHELPPGLLSDSPVPWAARRRLQKLLTSSPLKTEEVRRLCMRMKPAEYGGAYPSSDAAIPVLLDWLAGFGLDKGQVPLLNLARELQPHIRAADAKTALPEWLADMEKHFGIDDIQPVPPAPDCSQHPPCLMIELWLQQEKPDRYSVQAWLFYTPDKVNVLEKWDGIKLDAMPEVLEQLFELVDERDVSLHDNLSLEFFAHDTLFCTDFEAWPEDAGEYAPPIGTRYPVKLRSARRLREKRLQRCWGKWWNKAKADGRFEEIAARCACPVEPAQDYPLRLCLEQGRLCFTCRFKPDERFFQNFLREGAPIALWLRCEETAVQSRELDNLLNARLQNLPKKLYQARLQNEGRNLTLFWDDPERRPELKPASLGCRGHRA